MKHCFIFILSLLVFVSPTLAQNETTDVVFITSGIIVLTETTLTIEKPSIVAPAIVDGTATYFDTHSFIEAWSLAQDLTTTAQLQFSASGEADGEIDQFIVNVTLSQPVYVDDTIIFALVIDSVEAINPKNADQIFYPFTIENAYSLNMNYTPEFAEAWAIGYENLLASARPTTTRLCNPKMNCQRGG